jgi:hypothetical protein
MKKPVFLLMIALGLLLITFLAKDEPDKCFCAQICAKHKSCDVPKCNEGKGR